MDLSLLLVNFQLFPFWKQFNYRGKLGNCKGDCIPDIKADNKHYNKRYNRWSNRWLNFSSANISSNSRFLLFSHARFHKQ